MAPGQHVQVCPTEISHRRVLSILINGGESDREPQQMIGIVTYARIAGVVLLALAMALFGWGAAATFYHAGVGLLFSYVGFSGLERATVRRMIGGLGAFMVVVTAVVIFASWLLTLQYLHGPIEVTGLIVGVASILAARYLPDQRSRRRGRGY
jgi:hypothetical protein